MVFLIGKVSNKPKEKKKLLKYNSKDNKTIKQKVTRNILWIYILQLYFLLWKKKYLRAFLVKITENKMKKI